MLRNISDIGAGVAEPREGQRVKVVVKGTVVRLDPDGELVIQPDGAESWSRVCMPVEGQFKVLSEPGEGPFELGGVYRDADGDMVIRTPTGWYFVGGERSVSDLWAVRPLTKVAASHV